MAAPAGLMGRPERPGTLRSMKPKTPAALLVAASLTLAPLLAGCGQDLTGSGGAPTRDALYFTDSTQALPPLYLNETYSGTLTVAGGAGPYTARVTGGTLPPGVKLSGLQLSGKPAKLGAYKFTVEVTDSTLSSKSKEYTLNVNEMPPLSLKPTLPGSEIRGETRIPVTLTSPRGVRAARVVWELPAGASVSRVQNGDGNASGVLFWKMEGQRLTVDLGFRTVPRNDARVLLVSVRPNKPLSLSAARFGYEARDGAGKVLSEVKLPEPPAPAPVTPAATSPAATTPASAATPAEAPKEDAAKKDAPESGNQTPETPRPTTQPETPAPTPPVTPPAEGSKP